MKTSNPSPAVQPATIVEIVHLSDLHFGPKNLGNGKGPERDKSIAELLMKDLRRPIPVLPYVKEGILRQSTPTFERLICISGDFTSSGDPKEFKKASQFLNEVAEAHGWNEQERRERIFLIPGNHDLDWEKEQDADLRWQSWRTFYNDFYGTASKAADALAWVRVVHHKSSNTLLVCFDSEHHIHKTSRYRHCGYIESAQLDHVEMELGKYRTEAWFKSCAKIAMVHHHPILIPSLVEAGRGVIRSDNQADDPGYDAIQESQRMLNMLHDYGFHVLLHGHKHMPHVFTEDIVNACQKDKDHSMIIVAAGTLSSADLIDLPGWTQSYNHIHLHWNTHRHTTRIEVETRGLRRFDEFNRPLSWAKLSWYTMRKTDRFSTAWLTVPDPNIPEIQTQPPHKKDDPRSAAREHEYQRLKFNMPVAAVRPSLIPGQSYEVKFWITPHTGPAGDRSENDIPEKVIWSAGARFPVCTIDRGADPMFCGAYNCYGPMLIQAELIFRDGTHELAHIYANFPEMVSTQM